MRKLSTAILLVTILLLMIVPAAFAQPVGDCPPGFALHEVEEHTDHDHHIGIKVDLNEDGNICVKHLKNGKHVHVDNVIQ